MYQRLSEIAREVLELAETLAHQSRREYIGTEHVLLAILENGRCNAAGILQQAGVTADSVRERLRNHDPVDGHESLVLGRLRGTPLFEQAITQAIQATEQSKDKSIGTEHLLLGLLRTKGSAAQRSLEQMGVTLDTVQQQIQR
ncbi:MAG: ATP-dependent Clp protease ATP-binding subunit [Sedimentisphaerales bacterium]|nr:ATP-dependent Clp protease ATP-binding subunit [Sedimentisphaerales bacterium]